MSLALPRIRGAILALVTALSIFAANPLKAPGTNATMRIEGRIHHVPGPGTNLVFKSNSGTLFKLVRNPLSEALFLDTNLWPKHLLLTGRGDGKSFEVTANLHSISHGKTNELFYYCDICSISSSLPGLCQCCREPTVLTERPAND